MANSKPSSSNAMTEYGTDIVDYIHSHKKPLIAIAATGAGLVLLRRWAAGGRLRSDARLDGKVAIVTGGNCGIGLETAKVLASRGASVVLACRDAGRAASAVDRVKEASGSSLVTAESLDLASLQSVRDFARRFEESHDRLDLLINNAGVMGLPESRTVDGFETHFGVNHLGHFLLTCLLMPMLKRTPQARVVNVSSYGHTFDKMHWDNLDRAGEYSAYMAYGQSKLANVLFAKALAEKLKDDDVTAYSLHPGTVRTELPRHHNLLSQLAIKPLMLLLAKSPLEGAQTTLHCALAPLSELKSGGYYSDCRLTTPSKDAQSMEDARRLWDVSERLVGLKAGGDK